MPLFLMATTSTGPGWQRYNADGYGDRAADGRPWAPTGQATGHLWPLLAEERGEYDLVAGHRGDTLGLLETMLRSSSGVGLIPEQVWELADLAPSPFGSDPTQASIGFLNGHLAGSAAPLTWASGTYARLLSADPHCTVNPNSVPKAVDVLVPPGVSRSDELDYTRHNPVVIQPVSVP